MTFYEWLMISFCSQDNDPAARWLEVDITQRPAMTRDLFARCEAYYEAMGDDERHEGELLLMLGVLDPSGVKQTYRFVPAIERDWKELMLVVNEIMEGRI